jgi:hypothetical protein
MKNTKFQQDPNLNMKFRRDPALKLLTAKIAKESRSSRRRASKYLAIFAAVLRGLRG